MKRPKITLTGGSELVKTSTSVSVKLKMPIKRIRFATWLVRAGMWRLAAWLLDGAPSKVKVGNRDWQILGRLVVNRDHTDQG